MLCLPCPRNFLSLPTLLALFVSPSSPHADHNTNNRSSLRPNRLDVNTLSNQTVQQLPGPPRRTSRTPLRALPAPTRSLHPLLSQSPASGIRDVTVQREAALQLQLFLLERPHTLLGLHPPRIAPTWVSLPRIDWSGPTWVSLPRLSGVPQRGYLLRALNGLPSRGVSSASRLPFLNQTCPRRALL